MKLIPLKNKKKQTVQDKPAFDVFRLFPVFCCRDQVSTCISPPGLSREVGSLGSRCSSSSYSTSYWLLRKKVTTPFPPSPLDNPRTHTGAQHDVIFLFSSSQNSWSNLGL